MKKCFLICPIGGAGSEIRRRSDQLLTHIVSPVCKKFDFEVIRADLIPDNKSITETVFEQLRDADLVIADITDHNPNALFELGYRTALGKPAIHLRDQSTTLPFDIAYIRTIDYNLADLDDVLNTKTLLEETIRTIDFSDHSQSGACEEDQANQGYYQIIQMLFNIQDSISKLSSLVSKDQSDTLATVINTLKPESSDSQAAIMNSLLPLMLKDPDLRQIMLQQFKNSFPSK